MSLFRPEEPDHAFARDPVWLRYNELFSIDQLVRCYPI